MRKLRRRPSHLTCFIAAQYGIQTNQAQRQRNRAEHEAVGATGPHHPWAPGLPEAPPTSEPTTAVTPRPGRALARTRHARQAT
eukprot:13019512-Alexandrium_andersonii.AAC.1